MKKMIIEVRVNEGAMREENENVPWTVEDLAVDAELCHAAGASLIHYHCRTPLGGSDNTAQTYNLAMKAIRARCDILQIPSMANVVNASASERISNLFSLSSRPDFIAIEPGCSLVDMYDSKAKQLMSTNKVFTNTFDDIRHFLDIAASEGIMPYLGSFNQSWTRAILALADMGWIKGKLPLLFVTGGPNFIAAHPATLAGLKSHIEVLPKDHQFEWFVCCHGGDLFALAEEAILSGGHVSIGLGDHPYSKMGQPSNADLVRKIVSMAKELGREIATVQDVNEMFDGCAIHS